MGAKLSFCVGDTCIDNNEPYFSGELQSTQHGQDKRFEPDDSNSNVTNEKPVEWNGYSKLLVETVETEQSSSIVVESPKSDGSNESVLTVISPTKEKRVFSPSKRFCELIFSPTQSSSLIQPECSVPKLEAVIGECATTSTCLSTDPVLLEDIYSCIVRGDIDELDEIVIKHNLSLSQIQLQALKYSPLHVAVIHNKIWMAEYLLNKGVDCNVKDKDGQSALYLAYILNRTDMVNLLITHKVSDTVNTPLSPYGSNGSTLNPSQGVSRESSMESFDHCVNDTYGVGGMITFSRDNSFRSASSIDCSIQQANSNSSLIKSSSKTAMTVLMTPRTDSERLPSALKDTSAASTQIKRERSVSFSSDCDIKDTVYGPINTSESFDDLKVVTDGNDNKAGNITLRNTKMDRVKSRSMDANHRFGFQSPAHPTWNAAQSNPFSNSSFNVFASPKRDLATSDTVVDELNHKWLLPMPPMPTMHTSGQYTTGIAVTSPAMSCREGESEEKQASTPDNCSHHSSEVSSTPSSALLQSVDGMHTTAVRGPKPLGKRLRKAAGKVISTFGHMRGQSK